MKVALITVPLRVAKVKTECGIKIDVYFRYAGNGLLIIRIMILSHKPEHNR